jgi:hypothetical protein
MAFILGRFTDITKAYLSWMLFAVIWGASDRFNG